MIAKVIIICNSQRNLTGDYFGNSVHIMKTLSERLAYALSLNKGMSQYDLADAAGLKQPSIAKLLSGGSKSSTKTVQLANALGVSPEWLSEGRGDPIPGKNENPLPRLDLSSQIPVWDENGRTGDSITSPKGKPPPQWRAYVMRRNTGCSEIPEGTIVIVDSERKPGTDNIVIANVNGNISAYLYLESGDGSGFLAVDDDRIPLTPVSSEQIMGVAIFIIRELVK